MPKPHAYTYTRTHVHPTCLPFVFCVAATDKIVRGLRLHHRGKKLVGLKVLDFFMAPFYRSNLHHAGFHCVELDDALFAHLVQEHANFFVSAGKQAHAQSPQPVCVCVREKKTEKGGGENGKNKTCKLHRSIKLLNK